VGSGKGVGGGCGGPGGPGGGLGGRGGSGVGNGGSGVGGGSAAPQISTGAVGTASLAMVEALLARSLSITDSSSCKKASALSMQQCRMLIVYKADGFSLTIYDCSSFYYLILQRGCQIA
jgi:hypothetical protein